MYATSKFMDFFELIIIQLELLSPVEAIKYINIAHQLRPSASTYRLLKIYHEQLAESSSVQQVREKHHRARDT